jgi:arabinose-5-phosphate isomerase
MASIHQQTSLKALAEDILQEFSGRLDHYQNGVAAQLAAAVELLGSSKGKLIFCGLGKTGHLAHYAHAICISLGIKSAFLHAAEALHGDMGVIEPEDTLIYISFSGKGAEHLYLAKTLKNSSLLISGNGQSPLSKLVNTNIQLNMTKADESMPLNSVPTHSNTLIMLTINTMIMMLAHQENITPNMFAKNHPGGQIGLEMNLTIGQIMRPKSHVPQISPQTPVQEAIAPMTQGCCGLITIVDESQQLKGIFTDGDLRRVLHDPIQLTLPIAQFTHDKFHTCYFNDLAKDTLNKMNQHQITAFIVIDEADQWIGLVHIHDLLRTMQCSD